MSALMRLVEVLGIDPGPLNQTELQEQTCTAALDALIRAAEILRTSTAEHSRMWKESRQMESERNELAARVERLRESFVQLREVYEAEWPDHDAAARNRPEWARVDETQPAALAVLKAQWQAEARSEPLEECKTARYEQEWTAYEMPTMSVIGLRRHADEIHQRAQEAGDEI